MYILVIYSFPVAVAKITSICKYQRKENWKWTEGLHSFKMLKITQTLGIIQINE